MLDGLIITSEKRVFEQFKNFLSSNQHHFEYAESIESAEDIFEIDAPDYVFVVKREPSELLSTLKKIRKIEGYQNGPVFCFTSSPTKKDRLNLWENGANDIFELPILKTALKSCLDNISRHISPLKSIDSEDGMSGRLESFNMIQLLQILEQTKKTGILVLSQSGIEGRIWFYKGSISDASYKKFGNLDSVLNLMTWMEGDFSIAFVDEDYQKKIEWDNQQILMEGIQRIDKKNIILKELPPIHETLLISTLADMETMKDKDVSLLKYFHGGNRISTFLLGFEDDELFLLEKAATFVKKRYLITRLEFDSLSTELEQKVEFSGMTGALKKLFTKKEEKNLKKKQPSGKKGDKTFVEIDKGAIPYENHFQMDQKELSRLKQKIQEL